MMQRFRSHLSAANVLSMTALVVALGGTAYAASLPRNSVGSTQIRSKAVKNSDLGDSAVTSKKVKNRTLRATDFAAGQLVAGLNGSPGSQGFRGATGPTGPTGLVGTATAQFFQAAADLANGANQSYSVFCPAGQQAIGGGGRGDDTLSEETILTNTRPAISAGNTEPPVSGGTFTGWRITVVNPAGGAASGIKPEVWAICAPLA
jgi:hypothetical protein